MSLPDGIPRRGTAVGRPPVSLFALARTGYGPLRRRILGVDVIIRTGDGPQRRTILAKNGRFGLSGCKPKMTYPQPPR